MVPIFKFKGWLGADQEIQPPVTKDLSTGVAKRTRRPRLAPFLVPPVRAFLAALVEHILCPPCHSHRSMSLNYLQTRFQQRDVSSDLIDLCLSTTLPTAILDTNIMSSRHATTRRVACIEKIQDYFIVHTSSPSVSLHITGQWAVYDFTRTIPCGCVTTYKNICAALEQGSPQSGPFVCSHYTSSPVGSALRNNPFATFVPCHHIIASNLNIGGFFGEWGTDSKARGGQKNTALQCDRKMETCKGGCYVLCGRVSCRQVFSLYPERLN